MHTRRHNHPHHPSLMTDDSSAHKDGNGAQTGVPRASTLTSILHHLVISGAVCKFCLLFQSSDIPDLAVGLALANVPAHLRCLRSYTLMRQSSSGGSTMAAGQQSRHERQQALSVWELLTGCKHLPDLTWQRALRAQHHKQMWCWSREEPATPHHL